MKTHTNILLNIVNSSTQLLVGKMIKLLKENSKVRSALTSLCVSHYIRIYTSGIPKPKISDFAFFFEDNNEKRNIHMNKCMYMYMTFLQDQIFSTANLTVIC